MSEKDKLVMDFISEMRKCSPDDCEYIKLVLLSHSNKKPNVMNFLQIAFTLIESKRPLLIEMTDTIQI